MKKILITGGAGFIGSHVVKYFVQKYPDYRIYTLDKLTYAGNLENLNSIESASNHQFIKADIVDLDFLQSFFQWKGSVMLFIWLLNLMSTGQFRIRLHL